MINQDFEKLQKLYIDLRKLNHIKEEIEFFERENLLMNDFTITIRDKKYNRGFQLDTTENRVSINHLIRQIKINNSDFQVSMDCTKAIGKDMSM